MLQGAQKVRQLMLLLTNHNPLETNEKPELVDFTLDSILRGRASFSDMLFSSLVKRKLFCEKYKKPIGKMRENSKVP